MKKQGIFIIFLAVCGLYADYTNSLPISLNLQGSQIHNAIVNCSFPNQCTFNNPGQNFTLTSTTKSNTLTLNRQDPTSGYISNLPKGVPIYFGNLNINNVSLSINDFDGIIIDLNTVIINAKLDFNARSNTGSFSSYGNISLTNADFNINTDSSFSSVGTFTTNNSNIYINSNSSIFFDDVSINGGTATFEKGLSLSGQEKANASYRGKTINFTNNGGTVTINGDSNNGAKTSSNVNDEFCAQLGYCGNANLINQNGTINISGKLINQTFTSDSPSVNKLTSSKLTIQGGSVNVAGGVENKTGSSIDFLPGNNGVMGSLNADVANNGGTINANITGINQSGAFKLINGTLSGTNTDIIISGGTNMTSSKTCENGSIVVWQTGTAEPSCSATGGGSGGETGGGGNSGGSGGGNSGENNSGGDSNSNNENTNTPTKPSQNGLAVLKKAVFKDKQAPNGEAILATLAQANIVVCNDENCLNAQTQNTSSSQASLQTTPKSLDTLANSTDLQSINDDSVKNFFVISSYDSDTLEQITNDTDEGIQSNYLKQAYIMLDAMKSKELLSPYTSKDKFDLSAFASGYLGEGSGGLAGLRLNETRRFDDYVLRFEANYAYGMIDKNDEFHKASSTSHLFQLGMAQLYQLADNYELDIKAYASMGKFDTQRQIYFPNFDLNSKGKYDFYQLNGEASMGYRIDGDYLTLKPFIGLSHFYNIRTKLEETGDAVALSSPTHKAYNLDLLAGFETQSFFTNETYASFKFAYEKMLYNSHKNTIFTTQIGEKLKYTQPYKQRLGLSLGGYFYITTSIKMGFEGFYKTAFDDKMDYFGANIMAKYEF